MASRLSVLLYLWLCLQERAQAQEGTFLRPSLRAEPSSVVPQGTPVRLWCRGSPSAHLFTLRKAGPGGYADIYVVIPPAVGMEAEFLLSSVTASDGGLYKCCYRSPSGGSEDSEPLQLAVTGRFGKPSLWALPSPEEASGHEVTLQCQSEQRHDRAVLYKDGGPVAFGVARRRETGSQTNFSLPAGSAARGGTYSCYSFHSGSPYEWSAPSEPLALGLMGSYTVLSAADTQKGRNPGSQEPPGAASQDYTVGNVIRLSLAGLVLLLLGVLLAEAWTSRRGP